MRMHPTVRAFIDELGQMEKSAGLVDAVLKNPQLALGLAAALYFGSGPIKRAVVPPLAGQMYQWGQQ